MLYTMLVSLAFAGSDGPLVPTFTGAPRSVKIDLYSFAPALHPWGTDWKVTMMEQWSAVLTCEPVRPRVESCAFAGDTVWWGAVVEGTDQFAAVKLPAPGKIELTWTPRGRLGSWDVVGDRTAFWTQASNTILQMTFHRPDMVFKPDAQRNIGQDLEGTLTRLIAGALEWELPKKGEADGAWSPSQSPWAARRYVQSISSHKVALQVTSQTDEAIEIAASGLVKEQVAEGSMADFAVETKLEGTATFDRATGRISRSKTETLVQSTMGPLVGHTRTITTVVPWSEGDPTEPADMPEPRL